MRKAQDRAVSARCTQNYGRITRVAPKQTDKTSHPCSLKILMALNSCSSDLNRPPWFWPAVSIRIYSELARWRKRQYSVVVAIGKKAITFCQYYGLLNRFVYRSQTCHNKVTSDIVPWVHRSDRPAWLLGASIPLSLVLFYDFITRCHSKPKLNSCC